MVLSGEAGIGKSHLVQVVKDEIIGATALRIEYRCSPDRQHSALSPVIAHLERVLAWRQDDMPEDRLGKLEEALGYTRSRWRRWCPSWPRCCRCLSRTIAIRP